jgi:hypothetical protein
MANSLYDCTTSRLWSTIDSSCTNLRDGLKTMENDRYIHTLIWGSAAYGRSCSQDPLKRTAPSSTYMRIVQSRQYHAVTSDELTWGQNIISMAKHTEASKYQRQRQQLSLFTIPLHSTEHPTAYPLCTKRGATSRRVAG